MLKINNHNLCKSCFTDLEQNVLVCERCGHIDGTENANPSILPMGTILLGKYIIGNKLGKGGFGITYLAYDISKNVKVAIKEYMPDSLAYRTPGTTMITNYEGEKDEAFKLGLEKFYEEAKTIAKFNGHPNIINVQEFFYENNTAYFVMEYIEGIDLKKYVAQKGGKINEEEILKIILPIMDSLMIVHSIGVLHRDISPDNIYIANDGTVKLLDFGAARQVLGEQSKSLSVVLKPGFAPIEQYQTRGKQGPWTDVYSLAATMYYCLTGQIPDASMDRIDEDNLQSLTQQGVTVTPILEKALSKALSLRAVNRFQTIVEFKNALISNFEESIIPIDKRNHMSSVIFSPKNTTKAFNGKDALNISEVDSSVDKIQKIPLNKRNRIKLISSIAVVFLLFGIGVVALSAYVNNNRATKNTKNQITTNSQIYELNADSIASIEYSKINSNSIFQSSQINSLNSQYISKDITSNILHEYKYEIALITDVGTIDDKSYNQSSWEGVEKFAKEKKITYKYYAPTDKTTDAYLATIKLAVDGGAKIVVTPGFLFEPAIFIAQDKYPNVKFILLDGYPQDGSYKEFRIEKNVLSIFYAEEQAGFLAGYAAVKDGMKKLGFMGGMAVPVVIRFGYGFVQGADYAANEMKLAKNSIEIKYNYLGGFGPSPDYMTKAASWYNSGTEVIFAAAGGAGASVMAAAEEKSKKVIGVDIDQSTESKTVITSAMKMLGQSTYMALSDYYSTNFKGGQSITLDAKQNGIGLPTDFSKFTTFKKADYDAIYAKLVADTDKIASNIKIDKYGDTVVNLFDIVTKVVIIRDIN